MTAPHEHYQPTDDAPPMRTFADLRAALRRHGYPSDLDQFDRELAATDLDDLTHVREITQAYRHRVLLHRDADAATAISRSSQDIEAELRRKMSEADR
ncbi:hypothetical protein STTU_p0096 (plasmid) [Streptomyces sp. Tu6071]|uniref:hypothetical protein n=1 Tax=Streptomyces sp. Tu6071 TaxID=355249 RepID=UPI00020E6AD5|nr:hypothetical protein [Streptomyces sp. Tu6071]EGJ72709.1 hypothetical protein STTU_p0096 [Streptomyces sp. Tu6071]